MEIQATRKRGFLMRSFYYILYNRLFKPVLKLYLKTDSNITFDGFKLKIFKEVFHPKLFFSSGYFYEFLKSKDLKGKHFLEIGCGSGILSLLAFREEAVVTAVDVDPKAVENTQLNVERNFKENYVAFKCLQSDVFSNVTPQPFDMIVINPPYYFKKVEADGQLAWYCGENGEYFEKLFSALSGFVSGSTLVYMVLEENCELERITSMAEPYGIYFELIDEKLIRWERSYIFKITYAGVD